MLYLFLDLLQLKLITNSIKSEIFREKDYLNNPEKFLEINQLKAKFKTGFEASWSQLLFAGLQHQFRAAYTYAQDLEKDAPLPEIPPLDLRYHLSGNYLKNRLSPYITFRQVLAQARISAEFGETITPSFSIIDLGLSFRVNHIIGFTAGIENLLDANYYEHLSRSARGETAVPIHAPGRNLFLSFNLAPKVVVECLRLRRRRRRFSTCKASSLRRLLLLQQWLLHL